MPRIWDRETSGSCAGTRPSFASDRKLGEGQAMFSVQVHQIYQHTTGYREP